MANESHLFQPGHDQGIWIDTRCAEKERQVVSEIEKILRVRGFVEDPSHWRKWRRGQLKLVSCLGDDVRSTTNDYDTDVPYLFDRQTVVVTDNYLTCPTQYDLIKLPRSFFGIYSHDPIGSWLPDRSFSFSVNRLDDRRLRALLELLQHSTVDAGYVNFNCQFNQRLIQAPSKDDLRANFVRHFYDLSSDEREKYQQVFELLRDQMPLRNYNVSHSDMHLRSFLNIVIETYGSDTSVAFSEKIFRALVLPVPWTVYAGRYAVAYLESLGFDCLHDIVPHNEYDKLLENQNKIGHFISVSISAIQQIKSMDHNKLCTRTAQAAKQNRDLLLHWAHCWPADFNDWLQHLDQKLTNLS